MAQSKITLFRRLVWVHYKNHSRQNLPWRKTHDPYKILVSEIMLQQTQVDRVIPFYKNFLSKFPTVRALARAPLSDVLRAWQGLGYNRRAKYLHEAAKQMVLRHSGGVPREYEALRALPGIGDYTAKAVRTFAWNEPEVFIETNIRTVFLHHFFLKKKHVPDAALFPYMRATLEKKNPLEWYWALMDYGSYLKKTEGNASRRSAHHVKQMPFKGSDREIRGAILKTLSEKSGTAITLLQLPFAKERIKKQLRALLKEKLIMCHATQYRLHA